MNPKIKSKRQPSGKPAAPRRARPSGPRLPAKPDRQSPEPARGKAAESQADISHKLQKMLAHAGLGSRRDMEQLIEAGRVTVNGKVAGVGVRVGPQDVVQVDGRVVRLSFSGDDTKILLYHKQEGEIVSRDDPQQRAEVFERLPPIRGGKWIAIGRLDFNTSGLLIFTNSGDLANRLMHPRFEVEREYAVRILGQVSDVQAAQLTAGIELEDGPARFEQLLDQGGEGSNHWYRVVLKEGRKREVRRMFEALGFMVSRLIRVRFGILALPPRLKRGQWMELDPAETARVLQWAGIARAKQKQGAPGRPAVRKERS